MLTAVPFIRKIFLIKTQDCQDCINKMLHNFSRLSHKIIFGSEIDDIHNTYLFTQLAFESNIKTLEMDRMLAETE